MKVWLLLSLCLLSVQSEEPGIQAMLTENVLNAGLFTFYAFYLTSAHFYIGDYNLTTKVSLFDVDMKLTDINITSVSLDYADSMFTLAQPNLLTYTIQNLEVDATAGYDVKFGLIHPDPGTATVSLTNTNITITVALSTVDGKPQVTFESVKVKLGDIALTTQLPKEFNDLIDHEIHDEEGKLETLIPQLVTSNEPKINALLASLNLVVSCPAEPLAVDLNIVAGPIVQSSSSDVMLIVGLNGTVLAGGVAVPAEPAVPIPVNEIVQEGLQLGLSDFVVNSVLLPVWGMLDYTLESLPAVLSKTQAALTTDLVSMFIPQFRIKYGSGADMKLHIYTDATSAVSFWTDDSFFLNAVTNVDFWVYTKSNWLNALTLQLNLTANVDADLKNNAVNCTVQSVQLNSVTQVHTVMGNINTSMMVTLFNSLVSVALEELNPLVLNYVSARQELNLPDGIGYFITTDDLKAGSGYTVLGVQISAP